MLYAMALTSAYGLSSRTLDGPECEELVVQKSQANLAAPFKAISRALCVVFVRETDSPPGEALRKLSDRESSNGRTSNLTVSSPGSAR